MRSVFVALLLVLMCSYMVPEADAGPVGCIVMLGACAGPCFFTGPGFIPCVSLSCGLSKEVIVATCFSPSL